MTITELMQSIVVRFCSEFTKDDGYEILSQLRDCNMQFAICVKCNGVRHAVLVLNELRSLHDHLWTDWEVSRMASKFEAEAPLMIARLWHVFHQHKKPYLAA